MKGKILIFFLALLILFSAPSTARPSGLKLIASSFPVWLFTRNVCAEIKNVRVDLLLPAEAGCPHDFSLSPRDLKKLAQADLLIVNGLGLEDFLPKAIAKLDKNIPLIDAGKNVPALAAWLGPDPQSQHEPGHFEAHGPLNPHIFAAPREAALMVRNIAAGLARLDPPNAEAYLKNAQDYAQRLVRLSQRLNAIGKAAKNRGIVLQHDALAYLAKNAGLEILDIFGAMNDSAPSATSLRRLEKLLRESKAVLIAAEPQYSDKIVRTLSRDSGVPWATLNPVAAGPSDAPLDYYEQAMEANCQILEKYFAPSPL